MRYLPHPVLLIKNIESNVHIHIIIYMQTKTGIDVAIPKYYFALQNRTVWGRTQ